MGDIKITRIGEIAVIEVIGLEKVRIRDGDEAREDLESRASAYRHIPISEGLSESGGGEPGPIGGDGDSGRDGDVYSRGRERERRRTHRRASDAPQRVEGSGREAAVVGDLIDGTGISLGDIGALVKEFDFHTFGHDDRSQQANKTITLFDEWMQAAVGRDWREQIWPSKRNG